MAVSDDELRSVGPWPAGINNVAKEDRLPRDEAGAPLALRDAKDVDMDTPGWVRRRRGYQRFHDGELTHSLWSSKELAFGLFVDGGVLHALFEDERVQSLGVELGTLPVSYTLINDRIYFTNRSACGMVTLALETHAWAPHQPAGVPTVSLVTGYALDPGLYQVAVTFTDLLGRESGCGKAAAIDVPAEHGIALASIPQPSDPSATPIINVYCAGPNDQVLRLYTSIPAGTTSGMIGQVANGRSMTTQFLQPLPAGQIVRSVNGRQYVAVGREVLYSDPLRYGLFNPVSNRIRFDSTVDLLEPAGNDGLFVAAGKRTYWLGGRDPAEFSQNIRRGAGAVKYSSTRVPGTVLGMQSEEDLPVWLASSGHFCVGMPGGTVVVLKEQEAVVPNADRAAVMFRSENGLQQIVAALRGPRAQGLAVSDRPVAHVLYRGDAVQ